MWLLVTLVSACSGDVRGPVDHAEHAPPTHDTVPSASGSPTRHRDPEPFTAGRFDADVIGEASGVAASVRNAGWVYVLDDGPGTDGVVAVDTIGGASVRIVIDGLDGRDTEGLAVAACRAGGRRSCLFVGDIGNNQGLWTDVAVWRVREPRLQGARPRMRVGGDMATFGYEGRPRNAEALLVEDGRPFLVTKSVRNEATGRTPGPRLLAADRWDSGVLRDLGPIALPAPRIGVAAAAVGNVVTGGDSGPYGVVLRTYDHVVHYTPPTPGAPLSSLGSWEASEAPDMPALLQPEGVAANGCGIWTVAEGVDSVWLAPWSRASIDDEQELRCPNGDARS